MRNISNGRCGNEAKVLQAFAELRTLLTQSSDRTAFAIWIALSRLNRRAEALQ